MTIKSFIQLEILLPRLRQTGVLVVYDPPQRYRELCQELAGENRAVVDASESSIESRAAALAAFQQLGQNNSTIKELLIYVPAPAPLTDEGKQRDPFSIYGAVGELFPNPNHDGDGYLSLCLRARPDQATAIRRIFANNPNPTFAVIDAVGGGAGWPQLQAHLRVESARDLLFALLVPSPSQEQALKLQDGWVAEAKSLLEETLGLRLITRAKSLGPIGDELWRFLLFSEFAFDLPSELPTSLSNVPMARPEARAVVEDLCDRLRNDLRTQTTYISRAEGVEQELALPDHCREIADLGQRDTFPFEERTFFSQAVVALQQERTDQLRQLQQRHLHSVWVGRGENQSQWLLLEAAVALVERCQDVAEQMPSPSRNLESWIDFYTSILREVDRLHREFEQAAGDYLSMDEQMTAVIKQGRTAYQRLANQAQELFVRQVEKSGWPPTGRLLNTTVFDKLVMPKLQESGRRIALLLIDSLRYELGVELQKQLVAEGQVELQVSLAQLPTVTPVGMASLLPGAAQDLRIARRSDAVVPMLDDQPVSTAAQRMDLLARRYGQRFGEVTLTDFVRGSAGSTPALPQEVELLVIRSNAMDSDFESNPDTAPGLIHRTFQLIRAALQKLRTLGFHQALIATDHGFCMNTASVGSGAAGNVCAKPPGNWINLHERFLLGDGSSDAANFVLPAEILGIRGDFSQVAGPRALVAYRSGQQYFHGGLSLQEIIVPVLSVTLRAAVEPTGRQPRVRLSYKQGAKRITTHLPVIDVTADQGDLFSSLEVMEILLEAQDRQGNVVGEAKGGGVVSHATGTIALRPGESVKVTMQMSLDFEGEFSLKALDPLTMTQHSKIDLKTEYTV